METTSTFGVNTTEKGGEDDEIAKPRSDDEQLSKNEVKHRLALLSQNTAQLCQQLEQQMEQDQIQLGTDLRHKLALLKHQAVVNEEMIDVVSLDSEESAQRNAQLQVKVELETDRRVRLQAALDDAEKRYFLATKALEKKTLERDEMEQQLETQKRAFEERLAKLDAENERLERVLRDRDSKIRESKVTTRNLSNKAVEFEELFNQQLEVVKALQSDLNVACEENKALVKEMEMLNDMFNELERTHVAEALRDYQGCSEVDLSDAKHKDKKGKEVGITEILSQEEPPSSIQESCFKEVVTKNGTRMVLSVSKTFMKLKDLILEKKTLEDQMEKIKAINDQLVRKVSIHETKLFNITGELNKTWDYVSTIKLQHKRLHTSEQILRAELLEKRQLLTKLRQELEFSRQNWLLVKQKTTDSEREWKALREEFRARRGEVTSSESGFSDNQTDQDEADTAPNSPMVKPKTFKVPAEGEETQPSPVEPEPAKGQGQGQQEAAEATIPIFIPPMEFMAEVPSEMLPPVFNEKDISEFDVSYQAIYNQLIESTSRSAVLASRLAEVNRVLGQEEDASVVSTEFDDEDDDEEEDVEPRTEEDADDNVVESPEIVSDVEDNADSETESVVSDVDSEVSLECPFPPGFQPTSLPNLTSANSSPYVDVSQGSSSPDPDPALWEEDDDDDDTTEDGLDDEALSRPSTTIPTPPPPPPFSLRPPTPTLSVRPTFSGAVDSSESDDTEADNEAASENATAVTRFLIKHLPKQMSKLRSDKVELEDKIQELESRISEQNQAMREMERRMGLHLQGAEQRIPLMVSHSRVVWTFSKYPPGTKASVSRQGQTVKVVSETDITPSCESIEFTATDVATFDLCIHTPQSTASAEKIQYKIEVSKF